MSSDTLAKGDNHEARQLHGHCDWRWFRDWQATAIRFAQEGAKVVVVDIDRAAGEKTLSSIKKNGGDGVAVDADVSKENDAKQMADTAVSAFETTINPDQVSRKLKAKLKKLAAQATGMFLAAPPFFAKDHTSISRGADRDW